ncbi:hypothetical protein DIPPA_04172 [Diplonema papillatum]|nr:hypothetical protein DIPPA_04172 [Diplonema papillatum]
MVVTINKASVILCQVGQFISCIMHAVVAILFDRTIPVYASCIQLSYNVLLCILFSRAAKQAQFKREESQKSLRRQQELEQTIRLLNEIVEKQGDDPASPSKVD